MCCSSVAWPSWTQLRSPNCSGHLDVPASLLGLHPPPLCRDVEMVCEPDVREALHVPEQLVEHRDARVPADAEGVHDEQEAATCSVGAVELPLPDLQHVRRGRQAGHVREEAEEE